MPRPTVVSATNALRSGSREGRSGPAVSAAVPPPRPTVVSATSALRAGSREGGTVPVSARPTVPSATGVLRSGSREGGSAAVSAHGNRFDSLPSSIDRAHRRIFATERALSAIPESAAATTSRSAGGASDETLSLLGDISSAFAAAASVSNPQSNTVQHQQQSQARSANRVPSRAYTAKLCFLMDVTGSMEPHRNAVHAKIADIVDSSMASFPDVAIQVAFVGYRDVDVSPSQRFEVVPFTADVASFSESVLAVGCHGGDDEAEDVLGGLQRALAADLDWSSAHIKVIVHIGDSPHHGAIFHDGGCNDKHAELVNVPRPYTDILCEYADRHIDYNFVVVRNVITHRVTTKEMARLFAAAYNACASKRNDLAVVDLADFSEQRLFEKVIRGLSGSICSFLRSASRR